MQLREFYIAVISMSLYIVYLMFRRGNIQENAIWGTIFRNVETGFERHLLEDQRKLQSNEIKCYFPWCQMFSGLLMESIGKQ